MEKNWHLQRIYRNMGAGRFLPQPSHLSKIMMLDENRISRQVWLKTYLRYSKDSRTQTRRQILQN